KLPVELEQERLAVARGHRVHVASVAKVSRRKRIVIGAAVVAAAIAAPWLLIGREPRRIDDQVRSASGGSFAHLASGTVHYSAWGPEGGQPVVMVSGLTLPYAHFEATGAALGA